MLEKMLSIMGSIFLTFFRVTITKEIYIKSTNPIKLHGIMIDLTL